jgi:ATP-dependent DNA helicase RecG
VSSLIVLGKDPLSWIAGAYIQFLRLDGRDLTDPIRHQKEISGNLYNQLHQLDNILDANISIASDVKKSSIEIKQPDYPIVALQQIARNAVLHRTYESTNAPVKFYWFSDRIEIYNPGGLYGNVNKQNFGQGATDYRNPMIAEAMKVLGFVQRFGMGIPLAYKELEKNGNPAPEFKFEPNGVLAIVRKHS